MEDKNKSLDENDNASENKSDDKKDKKQRVPKLRKKLGYFLLEKSEKAEGISQIFKRFMFQFDRVCCFIGMCILRDLESLNNTVNGIYLRISRQIRRFDRYAAVKLRLFCARNGIDLTEKKEAVKAVWNDLKASYDVGFRRFFLHLSYIFIRFTARVFKNVFGSINYIAPILAGFALFVIVSVTLDMTFALKVTYNGAAIGYIADESVFDNAEKEVLKRIVFEDYIRPKEIVPEFSITPVKNNRLSTEDDITNEIIKASGNELTEASGLYVNGEFVGALNSRDDLENILDEIKKPFRSGDPDEEIEFVKDVQCRDGIYPTSSVVSEGYLSGLVKEEQSQQRVYTTVAGDSPILIAQKNGVPYSQLKALNPDIEKALFIGQEIVVEKAVPMLEVKVVKTVKEEEPINFKIEQEPDPSQYQGYVKVVQPGEKGVQEVVSKVTYIDGVESEREVISTKVITEPVNEKIVVGGKRPLQEIPSTSFGGSQGTAHSTSSNFIWPAPGGVVTCLFGNAGYPGHTGLDIGRIPAGSPVVAAASGTVVKVRYDKWGYGYHVIIDHGGNVQTLYGHNSQLFVKVGDWVEQGQTIAAMGRTGNASGVHVHFEVRVNGKYMNPANYVGIR